MLSFNALMGLAMVNKSKSLFNIKASNLTKPTIQFKRMCRCWFDDNRSISCFLACKHTKGSHQSLGVLFIYCVLFFIRIVTFHLPILSKFHVISD